MDDRRPLVGDDLCGLFSHVGKAAVFLASDDSSFVKWGRALRRWIET